MERGRDDNPGPETKGVTGIGDGRSRRGRKNERSKGWEMGLSVGIEEGKDHSAERQKS